jgi:DNA-binding transcriptional LysR family regulator
VVELRQLEYFLAVVEEGSFTRAAARLYMVQSSLSASLLALEKELGTELFIRGRRGAELTDAGRAFLESARAAVTEVDRARDAVASVKGLLRGTVRVATVAVHPALNVLETVRDFRRQHPDVHLHVVHDGAQDLMTLVAQGEVDFAITPLTRRTGPALRFEPVLTTPLVVLCTPSHRLAGARDVDPGELLGEPIIDLPRGWVVRDLFDGLFEQRKLPRRVQVEVDEWFGVLTMVEREMGIGYGPRACVDRELFPDVETVPVTGAPLWEVGIVTRDDALRGAAGRAFLVSYRAQCARALAAPEDGPVPPV